MQRTDPRHYDCSILLWLKIACQQDFLQIATEVVKYLAGMQEPDKSAQAAFCRALIRKSRNLLVRAHCSGQGMLCAERAGPCVCECVCVHADHTLSMHA